eukprot:gene2314-3157_t
MPLATMWRAVLEMDMKALPPDTLKGLSSIVPSDDDFKAVQKFCKAVPDAKLSQPEVFVLVFGSIPRLAGRMESWLFSLEFPDTASKVTGDMQALQSACAAVKSSPSLPQVLGLILDVGNKLNEGTAHGTTSGFAVESLPELASVKSPNGTTSILEYLVSQIRSSHPQLLGLPGELGPLKSIKGLSLHLVKTGMGDMEAAFERCQREAKAVASMPQDYLKDPPLPSVEPSVRGPSPARTPGTTPDGAASTSSETVDVKEERVGQTVTTTTTTVITQVQIKNADGTITTETVATPVPAPDAAGNPTKDLFPERLMQWVATNIPAMDNLRNMFASTQDQVSGLAAFLAEDPVTFDEVAALSSLSSFGEMFQRMAKELEVREERALRQAAKAAERARKQDESGLQDPHDTKVPSPRDCTRVHSALPGQASHCKTKVPGGLQDRPASVHSAELSLASNDYQTSENDVNMSSSGPAPSDPKLSTNTNSSSAVLSPAMPMSGNHAEPPHVEKSADA